MVYKTKGIILNKLMHADNKMIVQLFTADFGAKSYMVHVSMRKEKKKLYSSLLPMAIVDVLAEQKNTHSLDYIKEAQLLHCFSPYCFDMAKSSVSMFLNEILHKVLHQSGQDKDLYEFIENSLIQFDKCDFFPDFHLRFMIHLTNYLGFLPQDNYSNECTSFNCRTAKFEDEKSNSYEEVEANLWLHVLMNQPLFPDNNQLIVPVNIRNKLLNLLLSYYSEHLTNMKNVKSLEVFQTVLRY
jgi:DNA repair protein RecO (recombination protein O)